MDPPDVEKLISEKTKMGLIGRIKRLFKPEQKQTPNKTKEEIWAEKVQALRQRGAKIGDGTRLNCDIGDFGTEPYLVEVGEDCLFAADVKFITHDGGVKVLNTMGYFGGKKMDRIAPIKVGNNVYIGTGAFIMQGVTIGNNVIIGARAVVTHDIPDNVVAVGMPAKVLKTIDEYYQSGVDKGWYYPTAGLPFEEKKAYYQAVFQEGEQEQP